MIKIRSCPIWLFNSDWFRMTNVLLFGWSNGYNVSLLVPLAPQQVSYKDKEQAALIMNFHMIGGICIGSIISVFIMDKIPNIE